MKNIYQGRITLSSLKKRFNDRLFAIPELQRLYVWDKNRVCELMDSIFNHYPIGVFLIWRTHATQNVDLRNNNRTILPPFNFRNHHAEIVIDGQQRLSSLYGILHGITPEHDGNTNINFNKIFFNTDSKAQKRFVYSIRKDNGSIGFVSLHDILNYSPSTLVRRFRLTKNQDRELQKCSNNFRSYKYHALFIETNSIDEVRQTFIRINSQGMTVGRADTLFAKTTNIGLRDLVATTSRTIARQGLNKIRPETFVYTLALANNETRIGKTALESFQKKFEKKHIGRKEFQRTWRKYDAAFGLAADYLLQEFGITSHALLPSENIFSMISLFFFLNGRRAFPKQKRELNKWFWHTTIGERYSGSGFNKNIPSDIKFLRKLSSNTSTKYNCDDKINPIDFLKHDYRSIKRSPAVVGFYLFLKLRKPRYLSTCEPMLLDGASALANRKDRHHIYPHTILSRRFRSKWIHSLSNICLLAADENQSINNNAPYKYLADFRKNRFFKTIMKSHFIPHKSENGIWVKDLKRGFMQFLNERSKLLIKELEKSSGFRPWKLFDKLDDIKRL